MNEEAKKYFELKHEKLIKDEKELKEKLNNEVTKVKNQLEEHLSLVNSLIKNYEKINKGINSFDKNEENKSINIIKTLTYVSKLNKHQKEMNKIPQILMQSLQLDFIDNNIIYKYYYLMDYQYLKKSRSMISN